MFLGLDLGGTAVKGGVVDCNGNLRSFARVAIEPYRTPDGIEIPIEAIEDAVKQVIKETVQTPIKAVAISSQGETFVSLDENDKPLHNAIMWYDSRAEQEAKEITAQLEDETAAPLVGAIQTAAKIAWLKKHYPKNMEKARRHLLLPDYFYYKLTGKAVTDTSTAASSGFFHDEADDYSPAVLKAVGIDKTALAKIAEPATPIGRVIDDGWGLNQDALAVVGTNDQYAGALGAGNYRPGILSVTVGTCLALVTLSEQPSAKSSLLSGRFPIKPYYFILAYTKSAGVELERFLKDNFPDSRLSELDKAAEAAKIGASHSAPFPENYRALLESVAFNLHRHIADMSDYKIEIGRIIGGGAKSDFWMQMFADVAGLTFERPKITEAAVFGAGMLAAVGCGAYDSIEDCSRSLYRAERLFIPDNSNHEKYRRLINHEIRP